MTAGILVFLKAALAAVAVSAPPGPASSQCVVRTLRSGLRAGLWSAFGVAAADFAYAAIAGLGLAHVATPPAPIRVALVLCAAAVLTVLGVRTLGRALRRPRAPSGAEIGEEATPPPRALFGLTFGIGLCTVGTLPAFVVLLATLDLAGADRLPLLCGLAAGSATWWLVLCGMVHRARGAAARFEPVVEVVTGGVILIGALVAAGGAWL